MDDVNKESNFFDSEDDIGADRSAFEGLSEEVTLGAAAQERLDGLNEVGEYNDKVMKKRCNV